MSLCGAGDTVPRHGGRRGLGQPLGRPRVSTAPRSPACEGGEKFGSPSRVEKVPASCEGSAVPPPLSWCLPGGPREAFPGVDRTACGWMESWRGKQGWGWGWGCSPVTWGGDALLPVDTASVLAASSRGESKAGFPLGKWLCLLLALSACSGDNLFSCSSPELIAAFEVCKHARL